MAGRSIMPRRFPLVPRYERHGIRRRAWRGYAILYSIERDRLFVHRVFGPGRHLDRALGSVSSCCPTAPDLCHKRLAYARTACRIPSSARPDGAATGRVGG